MSSALPCCVIQTLPRSTHSVLPLPFVMHAASPCVSSIRDGIPFGDFVKTAFMSFSSNQFQTDFGVLCTAEWKRMLASRRQSLATGITTN